MSAERPIHIVGGGLAGLSLGLALAQAGVAVTLTEAGTYPRHRVCGEFIAGLDPATAAALGLGPVLADAGLLREVLFLRNGAAVKRLVLPQPALAISRYRLDERLAQRLVAAGGRLVTGTRVDEAGDGEGLVWTTGRRRSASPWIGLKAHVRGVALAADLEVHLGRGAYAGASAVEDGWINVCGLFRRRPGLETDRTTVLRTYLAASGLDALAQRVGEAHLQADSCSAVAGLGYGRGPAGEGGRLRLGDAASLIPPFTGNGMAMAFQSAALAVPPLLAWARGGVSWAETSALVTGQLCNRFHRRLSYASALHPFLYSPLGQFGLVAAARAGVLPLQSLYLATH